MSNSIESSPLLVFGAHPDDIEFGCGAVIALETRHGRSAHCVVCTLGEAASNGTPELRAEESRRAAAHLGASVEFVELGGDAHIAYIPANAIKLARIIRQIKPAILLATSPTPNQHPDHAHIGQLVRDAARIARYGGLDELKELQSHSVDQVLYYAVTPEGEPGDMTPILVDVSDPRVMQAWLDAMNAHESQMASRNYIDLQITRAKLLGMRAGTEYAMALFPNDPLVFTSLAQASKGARQF